MISPAAMTQAAWRLLRANAEPHPRMSKLKSPMPATMQPATTSSTEAVMLRGGAFLVSTVCAC